MMRRAGESIISLVGVTLLVFALSRATGDPVRLMLGTEGTPDQIAAMREQLGLNRSLPAQYWHFVSNLVQGDFGDSIKYRRPSLEMIADRFPSSVVLALAAMTIAATVGITVGVLSARRPGGLMDGGGRFIALMGQSVPTFWVGLLLVLLFSLTWQFFPPSGNKGLTSVVLPAVTLGWYSTAALLRVTRSSMRDALDSQYIVTARSKGLSERVVLGRHALKNSIVAILSMGALQFVLLLNGAMVTEKIFNWPGVGSLMVEAAFARDYALIQAVVVVAAILVIVVNLLTDIAYAVIDPRIRYR